MIITRDMRHIYITTCMDIYEEMFMEQVLGIFVRFEDTQKLLGPRQTHRPIVMNVKQICKLRGDPRVQSTN